MRRFLLASSAILLMVSPALAQGAKDSAPGQQRVPPEKMAPSKEYRSPGTTGEGAKDLAPGRRQTEPGGAKTYAPGQQQGPAKDAAPGRK